MWCWHMWMPCHSIHACAWTTPHPHHRWQLSLPTVPSTAASWWTFLVSSMCGEGQLGVAVAWHGARCWACPTHDHSLHPWVHPCAPLVQPLAHAAMATGAAQLLPQGCQQQHPCCCWQPPAKSQGMVVAAPSIPHLKAGSFGSWPWCVLVVGAHVHLSLWVR